MPSQELRAKNRKPGVRNREPRLRQKSKRFHTAGNEFLRTGVHVIGADEQSHNDEGKKKREYDRFFVAHS